MPYGITSLVPESMSAVTATPSVELGTVYQSGMNRYIYVYNGGTSTAGVGYGVVRSAYSAGTVTVSALSGDPCVGVVKNAQIGPAEYGWVVQHGPVYIYSANAVAARSPVSVATDGAIEQVNTSSSLGYGIGVNIGHSLSACASGTVTGRAWINTVGN